MREFLYPQGTRVRVRQGKFPMDPTLLSRSGFVAELDTYQPDRYGVLLDGETDVRSFAEDELEPLES